MLALALARILPTETLLTRKKAPPTTANLARALTCVIWAHMPGNMTRQLQEHLLLLEVSARS